MFGQWCKGWESNIYTELFSIKAEMLAVVSKLQISSFRTEGWSKLVFMAQSETERSLDQADI